MFQTDDKGVFGTCLTDEYLAAGRWCNLSLGQLWSISCQSIDYAFASPSERAQLQQQWNDWQAANMPEHQQQ